MVNGKLHSSCLEDMGYIKLIPNVMSYNGAISSCEKGGKWEVALHLLEEMLMVQLEPGIITYSSFISVCGTAGEWQLAVHLLETVPVQRDVISYNSAITACERGSTVATGFANLV